MWRILHFLLYKKGGTNNNGKSLFIYLFEVLCRFQHCTGHITTGTWKDRGNQYIQLVRVLYCKLPTNGKQLPAFPHKALTGIEPRPQRWEARVLPLCHLENLLDKHLVGEVMSLPCRDQSIKYPVYPSNSVKSKYAMLKSL